MIVYDTSVDGLYNMSKIDVGSFDEARSFSTSYLHAYKRITKELMDWYPR